MRPTRDGGAQAASAVGQGKPYRHYDELLQERGSSAQVLLTFFDMSARTHYLNARTRSTRRCAGGSCRDQRERHDYHRRDLVRHNDFLAAQVAILIGADRLVLLTDTGGLYSADPRTTRTRS